MSIALAPVPANRVCVLTPPGRAAVATVAVEGPRAIDAVAQFFHRASGAPLAETPLYCIRYGHWRADEEHAPAAPGEGVVVCRTAPQRVEVHCHGGRAAVVAIVAALVSVGFQEVDWRDWLSTTETDLLAAEARTALAEARTQHTAAILLDQYRGALRQAIEAIRQDLLAQRLGDAQRQIDALLQRADLGLHLAAPWRVVLAGRPNVGKSSLINALVGYQRAIVHDMPGVTRDVVTAATALDGWPVELADTAGVRESDDALEAAGVARTRQELASADVVALVFDVTQPWSAEDEALLTAAPGALVVYNKCDLAAPADARQPPGLRVSALGGQGLDALKQALVRRLAPHPPQPGEPVPFTPRQVKLLQTAAACLDAGDAPTAMTCLYELGRCAAIDLSR